MIVSDNYNTPRFSVCGSYQCVTITPGSINFGRLFTTSLPCMATLVWLFFTLTNRKSVDRPCLSCQALCLHYYGEMFGLEYLFQLQRI